MYKIIIADDEQAIREGLANTIPWSEWGYQVIGMAKNGSEVINLLKQTSPDVILTDIRMPVLDGLELSKVINQQHPNIKVVILSGYNQTSYLQEAIRNKVAAYLDKPTDYDEFEQEFKKLKSTLDAEREITREHEGMRKYLEESLPHMRENFFLNLVHGRLDDMENIKNKLEFYRIDIAWSNYVVVVMEVDNYYELFKNSFQENGYLILKKLLYLADNLLTDDVFFHDSSSDSVIGLCSVDSVCERIIQLQNDFFKLKGFTISAGISSRTDKIDELPDKWYEASQAVRQKIFFGNSSVIFYDDIKELQVHTDFDIRKDVNRIIGIIVRKEQGDLKKEILEMFAKFENKLLENYEYIDKICLEILFTLERSVGTNKVTLNNFLSAQYMNIFDILKIDTISAKKEWFLNVVTGFIEISFKEKQQKMSCVVKTVIDYVEKNYMSNNLSLESAADFVGKNPSYLSSLFKNETGQTFTEYVTSRRMDKGSELLLNPTMKVYEIAEQIGYLNVSNFIKTFKKHLGISPNEYRNSVIMNMGDKNE